MTTPPKGTTLQEVSQKTYQAVASKLPFLLFPTPEYFPSSGGLYDRILIDI